jgi:hypothetical protein
MSTVAPWVDSDRELLLLVRRIHDLFTPPKNYEWLLGQLQQYVVERDQGDEAKPQWRARRREYFEVTVFERGAAKMRDRRVEPDGDYEWESYFRELASAESAAVSAALKSGHCTTVDRKNGKEVPRRLPCFEHSGGRDWIYVSAWTPRDLASFDESTLCHLPLPPRDIVELGRDDYTIAEVAMGLTILHDSSGAFRRLMPSNSELSQRLAAEATLGTILVKGIESHPEVGAKMSWAITMEPLVDRMEEAMAESSAPEGSRPWDDHTLARNKFVYEEVMSGTVYETIIIRCNKHSDWDRIDSIQGVKDIAKRYAKRFNLEMPPKRQGGRRKKVESQ